MERSPSVGRFKGAPTVEVDGVEVPVAVGLRARLLGLARLDLEQAGSGLLIPRCAAVHTFGMRFALDLVFLDRRRRPLAVRRAVPPRMLVRHADADAVLELPAKSGDSARGLPDSGKFNAGGGEPGLVPPG